MKAICAVMPSVSLSLALAFSMQVTSAQAGFWDEVKADAAEAWESTKETASAISDDVVEGSKQGMEEAKKLGEKDTYTSTWEEIKHAFKNPEKAETDESGIPD